MILILFAVLLSVLFSAAASAGETPAGWKVLMDKDGACRLAVPGDWTINPQLPNMGIAPDNSDVTVHSQPGKSVQPMADVVQKAMGVDHMIENTAQRVFWASRPSSSKTISYNVTVPGKRGACVARIALKSGSEQTAKKIADTLAGTK